MKQLSLLTWKEVKEESIKENSIIFVTMAPIEQHSYCLPLATDLIEGEYWCKEAMGILESEEQYKCSYLPPFPIASASVSQFYGCIHFSMKTTYMVTKELLANLACMGYRNIVVIASHGDPVHHIAIEKAVENVNKHYGVCAISPMGAFFSQDELNIQHQMPQKLLDLEKKYPNDFHAGWVETSSMLAIDENYVRDGYGELPASDISDMDMISKKKQLAAMGEYGHLGNPTVAGQEIGRIINADAAVFIAEAVKCFAERKNYEKYMHHSLYKIPFLHLELGKKYSWKKVIC